MSRSSIDVGRCPLCGQTIQEYDVLITYDQNKQTKQYAGCPDCGEVVRPEQFENADV